ncbi:hypothetical protein [Paenibacillus sacheonensis]|uniref:Uncharacterized protein n=1 Tax=Paenibacillus sacheonensis TaxID=742054 RepID=A0A7X4YSM0_9BACL|nr:hypothetical protein [Paenibacillus sacheonensis]MBM7568204.1 hypothetical protein [Paenibacillus sacheonensis]NBC71798.1 hypothetical protein [Paenibacillus sacheonensis]
MNGYLVPYTEAKLRQYRQVEKELETLMPGSQMENRGKRRKPALGFVATTWFPFTTARKRQTERRLDSSEE